MFGYGLQKGRGEEEEGNALEKACSWDPPKTPLTSIIPVIPLFFLSLFLPFLGWSRLERAAIAMPQLSGAGGGGGGDPELCATDEMIPFKDEGDPQKEKIFAEISHPEEEGDLADIKSSLVNESETIPNSNGHEVCTYVYIFWGGGGIGKHWYSLGKDRGASPKADGVE